MLVYGAATLVLGLATYGYNIMAVLGNRITLHSPSRGFCMELGASITVILVSSALWKLRQTESNVTTLRSRLRNMVFQSAHPCASLELP
jgi:hypothetical protein